MINVKRFLVLALILGAVLVAIFWRAEVIQGVKQGLERLREFLVSKKEVFLSGISYQQDFSPEFTEEEVEITLPEIAEGPGQESPEIPEGEEETKSGIYVEKAKQGEGLTHLARRVLKKYLKENPQNFEVTPEHKVFIEDFLAKQKSGKWLSLGEEVEFSEEEITQGLEEVEGLSPEQLQNLAQYSQLVPSLSY